MINKYIKFVITFSVIFLLFLFQRQNAFAACKAGEPCTNLRQQLQKDDAELFNPEIGDYIASTVDFVMILGALMVLVMLLWGGIQWISSGGEQKNYEEARNKITAAVIGLAILASAWVLWILIIQFMGLDSMFSIQGVNDPIDDTPITAEDRIGGEFE